MMNMKPFESSNVWIKEESVDAVDPHMRVLLGIQISDGGKALEEFFWKVSDPSHKLFGRHLTQSDVNALTSPDTHVVERLQRWLSLPDTYFDPNTNILSVDMKASKVQDVFNTTIHHYSHHQSKKRRILRASSTIQIPSELQQSITFTNLNSHPIGIETDLSSPSQGRRRRSLKQSLRNFAATPQYIRELYGIPPDLVVSHPRSVQMIPEFFQESYSISDLELFNSRNNISILGTIESRNSSRQNDGSHPTPESSLDLQIITAMAPNATTVVWTQKGLNPHSSIDEPFVEWATEVLNDPSPPFVISISYSDDEEHIFQTSESYARAFDVLLMKMGARGISVLMSSGDDGVAGQRPSVAHLSDNERCLRSGPQWPTGSPYITTVGATMKLTQDDGIPNYFHTKTDEVACSGALGGSITTGGGFANEYKMPSYQHQVVQNYMAKHVSPDIPLGFFNTDGRGYPDLSAYGALYSIIVDGREHKVAGTSASTPVVAAMITLWNDRRLHAGKPPLGFINPLLYKIAETNSSAFNDIVVGNNAASQGGVYSCDHSFSAAAGWDAATGLGTPNFPVLSDLMFNAEYFLNTSTTTNSSISDKKNSFSYNQEERMVLGSGWIVVLMMLLVYAFKKWFSGYSRSEVVFKQVPGGDSDVSSPMEGKLKTMETNSENPEEEPPTEDIVLDNI